MKKISALVSTFIVFATLALVSPTAANADSRLTASTSLKTVFLGTSSIVSTSASSVSEKTTSTDWNNLKHEVIATQRGVFTLKAEFSQKTGGVCNGTVTTPNAGSQVCTSVFSTKKNVLYTTYTSSSATTSSVTFTQTAGQSQMYRIRAWIDRNNNDQIDLYEPSSAIQTISMVDPSAAKSYLHFGVEPPRFTEGKVTASISSGTSRAIEMMNPDLVTMKVHSCDLRFCERISGATTYNYHPQLARYEFTTAVPQVGLGTYAVEMFYRKDASSNVLMDTITFDYKTPTPMGVKTEVVAQSSTTVLDTGMSAGINPRLRTTMSAPGVGNFVYKAQFSDPNPSLIAGRPVFVFLNTIDLANLSQLRVNGVQISTTNKDQVILSRSTDADGLLTLNIQYAGRAQEQLKIDIQINGMRPYEFANPGSEEAILWDVIEARNIALSASSSTGTSENPITLNANVFGPQGGAAVDGTVLFSGDSVFTFDTPVVPVSLGSSISTILRISNFSNETGTGFVYARTLSNGEWISAKLQISWKGYGLQVFVGSLPTDTITTPTPTITSSVVLKAGVIYVSVFGVSTSDSVLIVRNGYKYSAILSADKTYQYKNFTAGSVPTSKIEIYVNGKLLSGKTV